MSGRFEAKRSFELARRSFVFTRRLIRNFLRISFSKSYSTEVKVEIANNGVNFQGLSSGDDDEKFVDFTVKIRLVFETKRFVALFRLYIHVLIFFHRSLFCKGEETAGFYTKNELVSKVTWWSSGNALYLPFQLYWDQS